VDCFTSFHFADITEVAQQVVIVTKELILAYL